MGQRTNVGKKLTEVLPAVQCASFSALFFSTMQLKKLWTSPQFFSIVVACQEHAKLKEESS